MAENTSLYLPPNKWVPVEETTPLIFLAGPIQGALDWQAKAIELLQASTTPLLIASPRRGDWGSKDEYVIQVEWETYHLRLASATGAILFWCAKEAEHVCERSYAQTTRFELAEWATHYKYRKIHAPDRKLNLILGIEEGYSGAKYIKHRIGTDTPELEVYSTLEDTVNAAINSIGRTNEDKGTD